MAETSIEWTHRAGTKGRTWNPTTGCDRISAGCDHCFALTLAKRLKGMGSAKYQTDGDPRTSGPGFGVSTHADTLADPLSWRKPSTVFVNSMSDLFHARVPRAFVVQVFGVMAATPQHTYQILTKRPERMARMLGEYRFWTEVAAEALLYTDHPGPTQTQPGGCALLNVWLGTSIESAEHVGRADHLRRTPATVRFVSAEPLLGQLDGLNFDGIDWLIVGGESGPGARPMHPDWARALRDKCARWDVAYFHKQNGQFAPVLDEPRHGDVWIDADGITRLWEHDDGRMRRGAEPWHFGGSMLMRRMRGKHDAGRELDGRTHDEYPLAVAS